MVRQASFASCKSCCFDIGESLLVLGKPEAVKGLPNRADLYRSRFELLSWFVRNQ